MKQRSLENVTVDGFRGLRDLVLEDLGPINLLVGENNSGKTSVLEALSILCNPFNPYEWLAMVRRRDFGGLDETRIQSLRWCFPQTGDLADPDVMFESQCEMTCDGAFPLRKLRVEYRDILGEPSKEEVDRMLRKKRDTSIDIESEEPKRGAEIAHYVESETDEHQQMLFEWGEHDPGEPIRGQFWEEYRTLRSDKYNKSVRRSALKTDTLTPYSYQLNRLQVQSHSRSLFPWRHRSKASKSSVLDLVREFDPEINSIEIASFRGGRPAIYVDHARLGPAPLSVFGDALRRAVLMASTLFMLRGGGVLLIDEVETGIHVNAIRNVFEWLANAASKFDVQVVATTHSLEAVDAIVGAVGNRVDDVVTFNLEQRDDATRVKRIPGELLKRIRAERGLDVR